MVFPNELRVYQEQDPKLSTKTSVSQVRETLSATLMIWEAAGRPAQLDYMHVDSSEKRILVPELREQLIDRYRYLYSQINLTDEEFVEYFQGSPLFKLQLEPLYMALGLIWRLAEVRFRDKASRSMERKGELRFPKILSFTKNMDLFHLAFKSRSKRADTVLFNWLGMNVDPDTETDRDLRYFLLNLSEEAVYQIKANDNFVVFNMLAVYEQLLDKDEPVDVTGEREPMGSLRILRSALAKDMWPFLEFSRSSGVTLVEDERDAVIDYSKRVSTYLSLGNSHHLKGAQEHDFYNAETDGESIDSKITDTTGSNIILYGVPGSGKSYTIRERHDTDYSRIEKVVFHPDYMNTDFVGQILPVVHQDRRITYDFVPGPFTRILKKAANDPSQHYFLIIEEINRGNAPAIFGEIFQLLDRDESGTSSDAITNSVIATEVYGDPHTPVRIPGNLTLYATMNTADQNIFALDTAFQRRWEMEMIENDIFSAEHAQEYILDTHVTWGRFATVINELILSDHSSPFASEDKRLGAYFITPDVLTMSEDNRQRRRFPEKVIKYLWDDAFKLKRELIFKDKYRSLEQLLNDFESSEGDDRFNIFEDLVIQELYSDTRDTTVGMDPPDYMQGLNHEVRYEPGSQ